MKGTVRTTTIKGVAYEVWSDFIDRATYAKNTETNEVKEYTQVDISKTI